MISIILPIGLILILSLCRVPVVASIIFSALLAGCLSKLGLHQALQSFNNGIENGASIALSYALLGSFASALARTQTPLWACEKISVLLLATKTHWPKAVLFSTLLVAAIFSQNLIPIHIAFIPIMLPPLLLLITRMTIDRRAIACILTFGLIATYLFIPVGFGAIYLEEILLKNLRFAGLDTQGINLYIAMGLPVAGMFLGLLVALFYSYKKPRLYSESLENTTLALPKTPPIINITACFLAIITTCAVQLLTHSMMLGALMGFAVLVLFRLIKIEETEGIFISGIKMMASIGFIMISAQGFAQVLKDTGEITTLVNTVGQILANHEGLGIFAMLLVGLVVTLGIGSSFSTIPIIATIFVPLCVAAGFSPMAIAALIATAGALGDAGSPASDSTLGPTAGLNADGQHDHMRDTVWPTFLHFNLPLLVFGWLAVMLLK
ncbi:MAG: hypothetical protein OXE99_04730 [Cellvibrionales bacterium]|nr:hypothetical protein [Cellvibrionales bacterium]